jgi:hypothetical protein
MMIAMIAHLSLVVILCSMPFPAFAGGRCCNNPTVWTFKNLDKSPIKLACVLERSVAWAGKPITMETETIKPGASFKYTWDANWYSDGMGMLPGQWNCRSSNPKSAIKLETEWGENLSFEFRKGKLAILKKRSE